MKLSIIILASVFGLALGSSIALAGSGTVPTVSHPEPTIFHADPVTIPEAPLVITLPITTISVKAAKATAKESTMVCGDWYTSALGTQVKDCVVR